MEDDLGERVQNLLDGAHYTWEYRAKPFVAGLLFPFTLTSSVKYQFDKTLSVLEDDLDDLSLSEAENILKYTEEKILESHQKFYQESTGKSRSFFAILADLPLMGSYVSGMEKESHVKVPRLQSTSRSYKAGVAISLSVPIGATLATTYQASIMTPGDTQAGMKALMTMGVAAAYSVGVLAGNTTDLLYRGISSMVRSIREDLSPRPS